MFESLPKEENDKSSMQRGFISALNHVSMYQMPYCMPLRLDTYNNLLNAHPEELCYRDDYLLIENIAPVGIRI